MKDTGHQKAYLCLLIAKKNVQRKRKRSPDASIDKMVSRKYNLPVTNEERIRVCLVFFCNIFGISKSIPIYACNTRDNMGCVHP